MGVVLAPDLFMGEAKDLEKSGHPLKERLKISKKPTLSCLLTAFLTVLTRLQRAKTRLERLEKASDQRTTDKVSRNGLRVGDILSDFDRQVF